MKHYYGILTELPRLLSAHGVRRAVMSPGSRNAALMQVIEDNPDIETTVIVDERCASFYALGQSLVSDAPVALVCTSGTALLNFGPAVCEAFYHRLPLIVISADRPPEWIGQADSQTMPQPDIFSRFTVGSASVDDTVRGVDDKRWMANRVMNDLFSRALTRRGPVHLNISCTGLLDETARQGSVPDLRVIRRVEPSMRLDGATAASMMGRLLSTPRVMIVAGQMQPSSRLSRLLSRLSALPNVVIVAEPVSNLHLSAAVKSVDSFFYANKVEEIGLLITMGGAIVSGHLKSCLRSSSIACHWHLGRETGMVDTYRHLTEVVDMTPEGFFESLVAAWRKSMPVVKSAFAAEVQGNYNRVVNQFDDALKTLPWCDLSAVKAVVSSLPSSVNLQLSNGTTVRYAQMLPDLDRFHRVDCNRGVSGIDGSTSTAVGASSVYDGMTVLITGDMSAMYDVGGMLCTRLSSRFRMIVIDNGGGSIFTNVAGTRSLPSHGKLFIEPVNLPLEHIARGAGMDYYEADSVESFSSCVHEFLAGRERPALLRLRTAAPGVSFDALRSFMKRVAGR